MDNSLGWTKPRFKLGCDPVIGCQANAWHPNVKGRLCACLHDQASVLILCTKVSLFKEFKPVSV